MTRCSLALVTALLTGTLAHADIVIHADRPSHKVSPTLYGLFFEDINRAGDGGLYAEMVQNRSFEDLAGSPVAWTPLPTKAAKVTIALDKNAPLNPQNPTSLKIQIKNSGGERVGVYNQGFKGIPAAKFPDNSPEWLKQFQAAQLRPANGMPVQAGKEYALTFYARTEGFSGPLTLSLETQDGKVLAKQDVSGFGPQWRQFTASFKPTATDLDTRLVLATTRPGTLWLDMVSMFPKDTYKQRPGGLRPDMVNMMTLTKPGLLRFPGGSFSEGHVLAHAWRWKETLGDVAARPGSWNIWGYRSTNGLGFHEYLQLAEDLGAEPLYVAHVGMAEKDFVPMDQLEPWMQDVVDAIEYANGPVTSKWGALRAKAGHPAPFNLKYVEIGNENGMGYHWGGGNRADYLPRYKAFYERLKATHPEIVTIANIHTEPDVPADVVDEHYYETADWFLKAATLYDNYDRKKPKIYVGEYAAKKGGGNGNLGAALGEAAFLTGVERNADVVIMTSYAPLFTNPPWERWKPNAIVFDPTRIYGTPSYHVQAMFGRNRPDIILPVDLSTPANPKLYAVAGGRKDSGDLILKVVNASSKPIVEPIKVRGLKGTYSGGTCTELSGPNYAAENSFAEPDKMAPKVTKLPALTPNYQHTFPANSATILRWTK